MQTEYAYPGPTGDIPPTGGVAAVEIRVTGTVQGVGFRPTVWRLANEEGLAGEVLNDSAGVLIRAAGAPGALDRLLERLRAEAPPLSRIESIHSAPLAQVPAFHGFCIRESVGGENRTRVTPDAAMCAQCRDEISRPGDRRFGYPFANCTHCGPRFSIVRGVPYDRSRTTMAPFVLCEACAHEYHHPADRRFHAQPTACAVCGPAVWIERPGVRITGAAAIDAALAGVRAGHIVAMRGLGGFHLVCDATNAAAVGELRRRKHRYGKPFALMARDLEMLARYCSVDTIAAGLLASPEAPIVLLRADGPQRLPDAIAPGLAVLGFMLPYTPLHQLLAARLDHPIVVTSGNVSHEPQIIDNAEALGKLAAIADVFLLHDREIANRIDDSVAVVVGARPRLLRRARGYAPSAMRLPPGFEGAPDLLAFGGELKSTFCLLKDGAAVLSQHQGDLEDVATFDDYQKNMGLYAAMYDHAPRLLVADLHPEYLSSKLAHERAADTGLELMLVQHHHAHVAACLAENLVPIDAPAVLGVVMDGLGFGEDGTIWGGEFLLADYRHSRRVGRLAPVAMPGGVMAIHEPWRSLYAHVVAAFGWQGFLAEFGDSAVAGSLASRPLAALERMLARGVHAPLASSCGRLFDAVAAALGMCAERAEYEAQGAMELEAMAARCGADERGEAYRFGVVARDGLHELDPTPVWRALLRDMLAGTAATVIAARFHAGVAAGITALARTLRGAGERFDTVVLSGGCFQNALLLEQVAPLLQREGFRCLSHEKVPTNDGGLALGQVAIAAARHLESSTPPRAPGPVQT